MTRDTRSTVWIASLDSFAFTSDPSTLYGYPFAGTFFKTTAVGATTLTIINIHQFGGCCDETSGSTITSDGTLFYTNSGEVWDPKAQKLLGTFLAPSGNPLFYEASVIASAADTRAYILDASSIAGTSGDTILGFVQVPTNRPVNPSSRRASTAPPNSPR